MKFAIISDTHFGDPMSALIEEESSGVYSIGPKYSQFKDAVGSENDYLILVGDIFDFSLESYDKVYESAKNFFLQIKKDGIAKEIIYIPGNHDAGMWHIVEHEINIIYQLKKGEHPKPFRMSVPGIIDDRRNTSNQGFTLPDVSAHLGNGTAKYAGLFLDHITEPQEESTIFNFAYPNLYIMTDKETIIVTHGQYFEPYWSLTGKWAKKIAKSDLPPTNEMGLKEMVGLNFPLCQLACSGIGQAGILTPIVRKIQRDIKDGETKKIKKYVNNLDNELDKIMKFPFYKVYFEWLTDLASNSIKSFILDSIGDFEDSRYNKDFFSKKDTKKRIKKYISASLLEIENLNSKHNMDIPNPNKLIFGHTHCPISWEDPKPPHLKYGSNGASVNLQLFNTGGWLQGKDKKGEYDFCGAEVFKYKTSDGISSIRIN